MISFRSFLNEEKLDEHIIHLPNGKWRLVSKKSGKNLGTYDSREEAVKREREVEYFKHEDRTVDVYAHNFITNVDDRFEENNMKKFEDIREKESGKDTLVEKTPPGAEAESWVKANKARFEKEYGEKKGKEILYAKAWEMFGKGK